MNTILIIIILVLATGGSLVFLFTFLRKKNKVKNGDALQLMPSSKEFSEKGWEKIGEENLEGENLEELEFAEAFIKIFEKNEGIVAFSILKYDSSGKAEGVFYEICKDWEEKNTYPVAMDDEAIGLFSDDANFDATFFRVSNFLALVVLYSPDITRRESIKFANTLSEHFEG